MSSQHNTCNRAQVLTSIALIIYTHSHSTFNSHLKSGVHFVVEFCLCEPRVPAGTPASRLFVVVSSATNAINEVHYLFGVNPLSSRLLYFFAKKCGPGLPTTPPPPPQHPLCLLIKGQIMAKGAERWCPASIIIVDARHDRYPHAY